MFHFIIPLLCQKQKDSTDRVSWITRAEGRQGGTSRKLSKKVRTRTVISIAAFDQKEVRANKVTNQKTKLTIQ